MTKFNFVILTTTLLTLYSIISSAQEEKKSIKLSLSYSQINNQLPELKATAKSKNGKKFEPVEGIEIEFYLGEQSPQGSMGKAKTNKKGIASFELPIAITAKLDSLSPFKFTAYTPGNNLFEEQATETEITKARIELSLYEADSTRKVEAKLLVLKDGEWSEVPETEMKLFVRRMLTDLPISENALITNETGEVSSDFNFKTPIPGDNKGNIIIGAKVEDNDSYGTIVVMKYAKWGIPLKEDRSFYERSLWASRDKTPIWLLTAPNIIIGTVWGLIFYIVYLIFRIRKIGLEQ